MILHQFPIILIGYVYIICHLTYFLVIFPFNFSLTIAIIFFMKDPSAKITTGINKNHFVIITKTKNENDI